MVVVYLIVICEILPLLLVFKIEARELDDRRDGLNRMMLLKWWTCLVSSSGGSFFVSMLIESRLNHQSSTLRFLMNFSIFSLSSPIGLLGDC